MKAKLILLMVLLAVSGLTGTTFAGVKNLRVEYAATPLGTDVKTPRFSWQMEAPAGKRACSQTAYRVLVNDPRGTVAWDSRKIPDNASLNIQYAGTTLLPATRYTWTVTVWDADGKEATGSSWFETGLMSPSPGLTAWEGATWIGAGEEDLVFFPHYLSVFRISYTVQLDEGSKTTRAGFLLGGNDSRLMDKNKNIFGLESGRDKSYICLDINISALNTSADSLARLDIYRAGYHPDDRPDKPFKSFPIPGNLINAGNKYLPHTIYLESVLGMIRLFVDGSDQPHQIASANLNPVGEGGDFISFPMLADIGFLMRPGQKASFSELVISNKRKPGNTLFADYPAGKSKVVQGGTQGSLILSDRSKNSMPMLRTEFTAESKKVGAARLYVTSRGIYEIYLNGQRVGNDYFNPGLTQYQKTQLYQIYDVTDRIKAGKNAMGAMLGEGWWSGNITYSGDNWNYFGDRQSLLAKLVITYTDGTTRIITTHPATWTSYNNGPVVYGSFFQGEVYDANREAAVAGWSLPGYAGTGWKRAVEIPVEGTTFLPPPDWNGLSLTCQPGETAKIIQQLTSKSMEEVRPGVFVYDMGQNMVGVPEISVRGGIKGNRITLRYAEVKYPDLPQYGKKVGMIMLENIRAALSQDIFILKGGDEIIRPRFTFHGYRFIEITGIGKALPAESVRGCVISSAQEPASGYVTSNPGVNKLWENITWSMKGNFLSIPTDCPQRNERMGWSGDISMFARTSAYLYNMPQFLRRHMTAFRDDQREDGRFGDVVPLRGGFGGILWGSAGITVAWESWLQFADKEMLAEHFLSMGKYISFLESRIDAKTGLVNEGPLGDWLSPEGNRNDNTLLWEAYFVYDLEIMAKIAGILGKTADAGSYRKKYEDRRKLFNERFVDAGTRKTHPDTQASYAVPLALGVFSPEYEADAARHLTTAVMRRNTDDEGVARPEYSLMTGFIGTAWISKALCDHGYPEIAYRMLQQTSYPSWLYSVEQGATTIWERLNSYTVENGFGGNNSMNSFNHYSFGAVGAWMYNYSLGIRRDDNDPGFRHFILQPVPDPDGKMTYAKGFYESMYGRIESSWQLENGRLAYRATVPANTTATLFLPASDARGITESGREASGSPGITWVKYQDGMAVMELKSGTYEFVSGLN